MTDAGRSSKVERLLSIQRATRALGDSAALWWRDLADAADSASTVETLDGFYRLLLTTIQPVLDADEISVLEADPAEEALINRISLGLGEDTTVSLRIPAGEGMAGRVLATKAHLVVNDLSTIKLVSPTLQDRGLKSVVAVPIVSERRILGVMHAGSMEVAHFSNDDAELLEILADRVAIAIERVRLLDEQRRLVRISSFLAETARIMSGAKDLVATLEELAKAALPALGDLCLIDMVSDDCSQIDRVIGRHRDPKRQHLVDRLRVEFPPAANSNHPVAHVLKTGSSDWSPIMSDGFLRSITHNEDHFQVTKTLGFRSYAVVPISSSAQTIGALTLVSCTRSLTSEDVTLAEGLANQVSAIVAKAKQLDETSSTSRLLQAALLPDVPAVACGLTIQASYSAASRALEVGGDFYDVVPLPDGRTWIAIGDVEGHDRGAAAEMGQLRGAIRTLAVGGLSPEQIVDELRSDWTVLGLTRTATIIVGLYEPTTGQLRMASAGHPPPLLVSAWGADYVPVSPNPPLGITAGAPATAQLAWLDQGDVLLFYTDGALRERTWRIDDAMAMLAKLAVAAKRIPQDICRQIIDVVHDGDDDTALLAVMRVIHQP
jgi:serine phosphatase RsbU (regulator of sigma subunit)